MASVVNYVNSTMNEIYEHCTNLYEAMMDIDTDAISNTIKDLKKCLNDIQKTYRDEEITDKK